MTGGEGGSSGRRQKPIEKTKVRGRRAPMPPAGAHKCRVVSAPMQGGVRVQLVAACRIGARPALVRLKVMKTERPFSARRAARPCFLEGFARFAHWCANKFGDWRAVY